MRPRITAAVVVACLATTGVSGCTQPTQTCAVADYGGGTSGYQTPQQALQSVLAQHEPGLSKRGGSWPSAAPTPNPSPPVTTASTS